MGVSVEPTQLVRRLWVQSRARPFRVVLVAALVAVPFAAMLLQLDRALDGDEGVYATMARLLLDGGVPYRDLFDNKPPLQYAWFSAGLGLFGNHVEALRLTTAIVMSATALFVYAAGRLLFPPFGGYVSLAVFVASQLLVPGISDGLPETLMLLPQTAAFVALLHGLRAGRQRWFLLAGLLFGFAVLTKPVAIWPAIAFVPGIVFLARAQPAVRGAAHLNEWRSAFVSASLYAAGGLIALLIVIAPFVVSGALAEFVDATMTYNLELSSELSRGERISRFGYSLIFVLESVGLTALVAGGVLGLLMFCTTLPRMRAEHVVFLMFSVATMVGMASTGFFFRHHYVQLFPVLALAFAAGVFAAPTIVRTPRGRIALLWAVGLFSLPIFLSGTFGGERSVPEPNEDPAYATVPVERREPLSDGEFLAAWDERNAALGAYLRAHTSDDDRIHVHGGSTSRTPVYFYADRDPAARYFFEWALRPRASELDVLIEELRIVRPRFIIDTFGPDYRYNVDDDFDARPAAFLALLAEQYELVGTVNFADVYRLLEP